MALYPKPKIVFIVNSILALLACLVADTVYVFNKAYLADWMLYAFFGVVVLPLFYYAFCSKLKRPIIRALVAVIWTLLWFAFCMVVMLMYHHNILKAPM